MNRVQSILWLWISACVLNLLSLSISSNNSGKIFLSGTVPEQIAVEVIDYRDIDLVGDPSSELMSTKIRSTSPHNFVSIKVESANNGVMKSARQQHEENEIPYHVRISENMDFDTQDNGMDEHKVVAEERFDRQNAVIPVSIKSDMLASGVFHKYEIDMPKRDLLNEQNETFIDNWTIVMETI